MDDKCAIFWKSFVVYDRTVSKKFFDRILNNIWLCVVNTGRTDIRPILFVNLQIKDKQLTGFSPEFYKTFHDERFPL